MKPELQEKIYTWITEAAQKVGDWSSTEIPLFVTEYLQWKFVEAAMYTVVWTITMAIAVAIASAFIPSFKRWCFDEQRRMESADMSIAIFVIVTFISVVIATLSLPYDEIKDMLQIHIAPKVYLLEKASELLKK